MVNRLEVGMNWTSNQPPIDNPTSR